MVLRMGLGRGRLCLQEARTDPKAGGSSNRRVREAAACAGASPVGAGSHLPEAVARSIGDSAPRPSAAYAGGEGGITASLKGVGFHTPEGCSKFLA